MPTIRYKVRRRLSDTNEFTEHKQFQLDCGHDFFHEGYPDTPEGHRQMKADWRRHKRSIMREHISREPGSRPWAWWEFDSAPYGQRRLLEGRYSPLSDKIWFGQPCWYNIGDPPPVWETEEEFLDRHGLLGDQEKTALSIAHWRKDEQELKKGTLVMDGPERKKHEAFRKRMFSDPKVLEFPKPGTVDPDDDEQGGDEAV
jgi:hypothetical protein